MDSGFGLNESYPSKNPTGLERCRTGGQEPPVVPLSAAKGLTAGTGILLHAQNGMFLMRFRDEN